MSYDDDIKGKQMMIAVNDLLRWIMEPYNNCRVPWVDTQLQRALFTEHLSLAAVVM